MIKLILYDNDKTDYKKLKVEFLHHTDLHY